MSIQVSYLTTHISNTILSSRICSKLIKKRMARGQNVGIRYSSRRLGDKS